MKKLAFIIALTPFLFGCNNNAEQPKLTPEDSLRLVTEEQERQLMDMDSSLAAFIIGYNAISENLAIIKEKENIVSDISADPEKRGTMQEQIIADIQSMYDIMYKNKQQLEKLERRLGASNRKNAQLQNFIKNLKATIEEKSLEITDLRTQLELMNIEMTDLQIMYSEEKLASEEKTKKLNTAYYSFGTSKELSTNGVLTKEGGFIGLGRISKMKADFNKNYFTEVDITSTETILLSAKKAKVVTTHPSSSYRLVKTEKGVERINITNPELFWSASKYLVIVVQ